MLIDGRKSFPSGHSSSAACGSVYAAAFVLYAAFLRTPRPTQLSVSVVQHLGFAAALYWALTLLLYALFVGVTRYGVCVCDVSFWQVCQRSWD